MQHERAAWIAMTRPPLTPESDGVMDVVVRALTPYVGANMAGAIARGHCEKLGIRGAVIDDAHLDALTDALRPGLNVFVGRDTTERVIARVRAACGRGESAERDVAGAKPERPARERHK
jgi:hypothetical protein